MAKKLKPKWQDIYDVVGIEPGIIVNPVKGEIDLRNPDLPISTLDFLFERKCKYIKLKTQAEPEKTEN